MLELPDNWEAYSIGYVLTELLRQARAIGHYTGAARAMTQSSLEFMLSGPRWTNRPNRTTLIPHSRGWRINKWLFYVLPSVEDDVLDELAELPKFRCNVDLIVPPWATRLARHVVEAVLPRYHVDVYSISSYIDLRVLWTRIDMDMPRSDALSNLFQRYSLFVRSMPVIAIKGF